MITEIKSHADGANAMTYLDHLKKQLEKEGATNLNKKELEALKYKGKLSKYDL